MNFTTIKQKVLNRLWLKSKDSFYDRRVKDTAIVQNINYTSSTDQKTAVIVYLTMPFVADWRNNNIGRTQPFEILSMVRVMSEAGFCIDVIGCHDVLALNHLKEKKYDLILGFGEAFYRLTLLHPNAISILYMTEHHPDFTRKEEQKRLDYFYERHGKRAKPVRTGNFYWDRHMQKKYSHVITLSETEPFKDRYENVFNIFPTGILNPNFIQGPKDFNSARKHFLWFGSYGAIHKGLDLLFDIFEKRDDIVLHIGGFYKDDRKIIRLPKRKNIIDYGYIDIKSEDFLKLVNKCAYTILPSCSEGFSTAITTGMLHGLIPVVMRDTGFNRLEENALFLDNYKIDFLASRISEISEMNTTDLENMSKKVHGFAKENFTPISYEKKFQQIINNILKTNIND